MVYAQRCREAFPEANVVIGSIEASLRRIAHYDYWSDKVRRSVLPDSKADMLVFGSAERAIVALAHRLAAGEAIAEIRDLRGTAFMAVSYTHLDVYKRQSTRWTSRAASWFCSSMPAREPKRHSFFIRHGRGGESATRPTPSRRKPCSGCMPGCMRLLRQPRSFLSLIHI